jgi:drug/metabolite transporter (DMT)-like permease
MSSVSPALLASLPPPARARHGSTVILCLAAVYLIWSSTFLALRIMVAHLPPLLAGGARFLAAGGLLYAFLRVRGAAPPSARQWALSSLVGGVMFVAGHGSLTMAEQWATSGVAAMSFACIPLFLALFEAALGRRPSRRQMLGLALGFVGVATMGAADMHATPRAGLLLLVAPIAWALGSLWTRRLGLPRGAMAGAAQMIPAGALSLLAGGLAGERLPTTLPLPALLAFAYLVFFGSIVGYTAFTHLLRNTSTLLATSYAYVNPILAIALGAAVAGERPGAGALLAGALVVAGVVLLATERPASTAAPLPVRPRRQRA